jgi:hypothetical protein
MVSGIRRMVGIAARLERRADLGKRLLGHGEIAAPPVAGSGVMARAVRSKPGIRT